MAGIVIAFLKNVLHIVLKGTSSAFVGELCNFALNAVFAVAAGLIYKFHKNRTGAILGSLAGAVAMGLFSVPLNYFLVYPAYAAAFGGMELIVGAYQTILPSVNGLLECLLIFNLPFTIVKGLLCAAICFLIYKPLSPLLHGGRTERRTDDAQGDHQKNDRHGHAGRPVHGAGLRNPCALIPVVPFLEYDPADIPILIAAMAYGPVSGLVLTVVVSIIQGMFISTTGPWGILMHVIATGTWCWWPAASTGSAIPGRRGAGPAGGPPHHEPESLHRL